MMGKSLWLSCALVHHCFPQYHLPGVWLNEDCTHEHWLLQVLVLFPHVGGMCNIQTLSDHTSMSVSFNLGTTTLRSFIRG